jgi:TatD DNase family protein
MMSFVDTHCHLDLEAFDGDRHEVFGRALASGVHAMVLIGYNPERWRSTETLCNAHPYLRRAVGLHPNDAALWNAALEGQLVETVQRTHPVAIGETGLDFFRSNDTRELQIQAFERQIDLAASLDLPVVIHQRSAEQDVLDILNSAPPIRGVMHCFSGDTSFANACVELGLHIGIGGVATFPKSHDVRDALRVVPHEKLVLETDAPFLAPQVHRGKRNESSYVPYIAQVVAETLDMTIDQIAEITTRNTIALFGPGLGEAVCAGMETE